MRQYLGVHLSSKLSWNDHVDITAKKAYQTLNYARSNFSTCQSHIREQCYKTLVRPQLEYASSVWDNSVKRNVNKIEAVQCVVQHASPVVTDYWHTQLVNIN